MRRLHLSILLAVFACSLAQASEVNKAHWMESMETDLPAAFCSPNQYFRQCFEVSAAECEETAASTTRTCMNRHESDIPATLVQPEDGTHWGTIIGECAGRAYDIALSEKRISSAECDDVSNWR